MRSARDHIESAKLAVTVLILGGFIASGLLARIVGLAAWALAPIGLVAAAVVVVRGLSAARAANLALNEERFGVLGLTAEPTAGGGVRYRGAYAGRHVEASQRRAELSITVGARLKSNAAATAPKRLLGEPHVIPPMAAIAEHGVDLPPGVELLSEDSEALRRFVAEPDVAAGLAELFREARRAEHRRVILSPARVALWDAQASLPSPELARRTLELLVSLAAAAERAGV